MTEGEKLLVCTDSTDWWAVFPPLKPLSTLSTTPFISVTVSSLSFQFHIPFYYYQLFFLFFSFGFLSSPLFLSLSLSKPPISSINRQNNREMLLCFFWLGFSSPYKKNKKDRNQHQAVDISKVASIATERQRPQLINIHPSFIREREKQVRDQSKAKREKQKKERSNIHFHNGERHDGHNNNNIIRRVWWGRRHEYEYE